MEVLLNKHYNKCFSLARRACEENFPESNFFLLKSLKAFLIQGTALERVLDQAKPVLTGKVGRLTL